MLGLAAGLQKGGSALLNYVKDNLKLYLDFTSTKSDTLKFPCEGSTSFDGNDYIDCGDDTSLDITSTITISSWVYLNQVNESCYIIGREDGAVRNYILFAHSDGKFYFQVNISSSTKSVGSTTTYVANRWYHVSGTYDGSQQKLYVDGVLEDDDAETGSIDNGNASLWIGAAADGDKYFNGKIANVGLWSRALSAEEVSSVMKKNYSQLGSVEKTRLVSWWALDNLEGNGVLDLATTEVLGSSFITGDNSDMDTTGSWASGSSDFALSSVSGGNPGNCLKVLNVKGSPATNYGAYLEHSALTSGKLYKLTFDVKNDGVMTENLKFFSATTEMKDEIPTTSSWVTQTIYFIADSTANYLTINVDSAIQNGEYYMLDNVFLQEVTSGNHGVPSGATTTTSVYGGNAPVLPRAVDVAREGEAEQIGDGSALFVASNTDYISLGSLVGTPMDFTTGSFTLACWAKTSTTGNDGIFCKELQWQMLIDSSNKLQFALYDGTNNPNISSGTSINTGEWVHLACVRHTADDKLYVYVNGILDGSTTDTTTATISNSDDVEFGRRGSSEPFNGNIAQAGAWQGVLTQAQIQSVMESTSYDKIPADVKSTLGSELVDSNVASSWTDNGDGSTITNITNGVSIADDSSYSDLGKLNNAGLLSTDLTLGKLYKVQFDSYHNGTGTPSVRLKDGSANQIIDVTSSNATYIRYILANTSVNEIMFRTQDNESGSVVYLTNVSVKEVTNDLVGYWGLDSSDYTSASNHITNGDASSSSPVKPEWNISGQDFTYNEYNSSIARVTDFGSSNTNSWKVTVSAGDGNWGMKTTDADMNVGRSYKVTAKVYIPSSTDISSVSMRWFKGSSGLGESVSTTTKDSWTELTFTIPSFWSNDGSYAQIVSFGQSGASASDYFYFDDLVIKPHSVPDSTDNNNVGDLI